MVPPKHGCSEPEVGARLWQTLGRDGELTARERGHLRGGLQG